MYHTFKAYGSPEIILVKGAGNLGDGGTGRLQFPGFFNGGHVLQMYSVHVTAYMVRGNVSLELFKVLNRMSKTNSMGSLRWRLATCVNVVLSQCACGCF